MMWILAVLLIILQSYIPCGIAFFPGHRPLIFRRSKDFGVNFRETTFAVESMVKREVDCMIDGNKRRFHKATKQIVTLGPSSNTEEMVEKLFLAGADVFRLNFSHGKHIEKSLLVDIIRKIEKKYNHPIAILADLQGPKLRVGAFQDSKVDLVPGQLFRFDLNMHEPGTAERVSLPHPEILFTLKTGDMVLLDDGRLSMRVVHTTMQPSASDEGYVQCEVLIGGPLSDSKGVNVPSIVLPISPLTTKDKSDANYLWSVDRDLACILSLEIDWVALSFVQRPQDVDELRALAGPKLKIMAKLEKPSAIESLKEIVERSDGIMVARGDLGVEMSPWDVPVLQKRIVETCKALGRPVVIATQMMESMVDRPSPTRAEASDCATAIFDSSDAVMLSGESANGRYPVEAVHMQQQIIATVEGDAAYQRSLDRFALDSDLLARDDPITVAITLAARQVADISGSKCIVAFTSSGTTARRVSKIRPKVPIVAICEDIYTARQLALVWGIYPMVVDNERHVAGLFDPAAEIDKACQAICAKGFANASTNDLLTFTGGLPYGFPGTTNIVRVTSAAGSSHNIGGLLKPKI